MFIEKAHLVQIMYKYVQCTYLYIVHQANWGDATICHILGIVMLPK